MSDEQEKAKAIQAFNAAMASAIKAKDIVEAELRSFNVALDIIGADGQSPQSDERIR